MDRFVTFALDERRFALPLECAERAVPVVDVTPLPQAPEIVCGVINVRGSIVPVVSVRRRFGLEEREPSLDEHLLIARAGGRTLALPVDVVLGVVEIPHEDVTAAEALVPGAPYVSGVAKLPDGLVLIHDLATFLSLDEAASLDRALAGCRDGSEA